MSENRNRELTKRTKAAILIMYLDRDISRRLLKNLSDTEVKEIGMAMSTIKKISPQEIEVVVTEFMKNWLIRPWLIALDQTL